MFGNSRKRKVDRELILQGVSMKRKGNRWNYKQCTCREIGEDKSANFTFVTGAYDMWQSY